MDVIVPKVNRPEPAQKSATKKPSLKGDAGTSENPQEAYLYFDKRDEAQIVDALKGRFLDEFVFSYCKRHRDANGQNAPACGCPDAVVGLSWLGVQEAAREYKGIRVPVEKMIKRETEDAVEVIVEAVDETSGNSRIGVASQPKKLRLRSGSFVNDEFCVSKAVSKAQRNAIRPLLPATLIKSWIETKLRKQTPATSPAPTTRPARQNSNGTWHPSAAQVKRAFALAFGNKVSRQKFKQLVRSICGVEDPAQIGSRAGYDALCDTLQRGGALA